MNIQHEPLFDTAKVEELYGRKDGCEIRYVCTSDLNASDVPCDIFYRAEPHPDFGNRYFGLYWDSIRDCMMITNADIIESFEFGMIKVDGKYYYSQSHHDYKVVGNKMIDGGRAYIKSSGGTTVMRITNGKFYAADVKDLLDLHINEEKEYE
ncbi:hypothetical protein N9D61_01930 [Planktomarina sp.]|jgi:hypothetical protein|nr:hypothetical protein [Planktomarina sp.]